jgi:hypothetical protein
MKMLFAMLSLCMRQMFRSMPLVILDPSECGVSGLDYRTGTERSTSRIIALHGIKDYDRATSASVRLRHRQACRAPRSSSACALPARVKP